MSHTFQLPDDLYKKLAAYAAQHKQTPEMLFLSWAHEVVHGQEKSATIPSDSVEHKRKEQIIKEKQDTRKEEPLTSPLFQIAGMFAIGESGWADKHDEYLAEAYLENHADDK